MDNNSDFMDPATYLPVMPANKQGAFLKRVLRKGLKGAGSDYWHKYHELVLKGWQFNRWDQTFIGTNWAVLGANVSGDEMANPPIPEKAGDASRIGFIVDGYNYPQDDVYIFISEWLYPLVMWCNVGEHGRYDQIVSTLSLGKLSPIYDPNFTKQETVLGLLAFLFGRFWQVEQALNLERILCLDSHRHAHLEP